MSNKALVSVLIPAYNHEKYVQETIKSIIDQSYKNIELIVLDDGSKDSSWEKILDMQNRCEQRFARVHFETKENEGTCKTLNKLMDLANGEFIFMIASDDLAKPNAIEEEINFLETHQDYSLAVGDNEIVDSESNVVYWDKDRNIVYDKEKAKYLTFKQFLEEKSKVKFSSDKFGTYESLYMGNYIPSGFLLRKSTLELFGGYDLNAPLEDWYLVMQIAKYSKMKFIDKVFLSYRWHDSNSIKNEEKMNLYSRLTSEYEEKVLNTIDESKVMEDVIRIKRYGYCYKKQGIPNIFQVLTIKKGSKKIKKILVFNVPVFSYEKNL